MPCYRFRVTLSVRRMFIHKSSFTKKAEKEENVKKRYGLMTALLFFKIKYASSVS